MTVLDWSLVSDLKSLPVSGVESIDQCPLRFLYGKLLKKKHQIPSVPAMIGNIGHHVLEFIEGKRRDGNQFEKIFSSLWAEGEEKELEQLRENRYAQHLLEPKRWPKYFVQRSRIKRLARKIWGLREKTAVKKDIERETFFRSEKLGLSGKVDRIEKTEGGAVEIIDWKTGAISDSDGEMKASYKTQLLLYGSLYSEDRDIWPSLGKVVDPKGNEIQIDLERTEAESILQRSKKNLDQLRDACEKKSLDGLANPEKDSCRWCSFRAFCDEYWDKKIELEASDVQGKLESVARSESASTLVVRIRTVDASVVEFVSLEQKQFEYLSDIKIGSNIRAVDFSSGMKKSVCYPRLTSHFVEVASL